MKILEDIWNEIESNSHLGKSKFNDETLREAVLEKGDAIRAIINKEQLSALEAYENQIYILEAHHELEAFKQGVSFTVRFILEAFLEK